MCSIPLITRRSSTGCAPRGPRESAGSSRAHSASLRQYSCLAIHVSTVWKLERKPAPLRIP